MFPHVGPNMIWGRRNLAAAPVGKGQGGLGNNVNGTSQQRLPKPPTQNRATPMRGEALDTLALESGQRSGHRNV